MGNLINKPLLLGNVLNIQIDLYQFNSMLYDSSHHTDILQTCLQLGFSILLSLLSYETLLTRTNYQIRYFAGKGNFLLCLNNIGTIYAFFFD